MLHIRTKPSLSNDDLFIFIHSNIFRKTKKSECFFESDIINRLTWWKIRITRLLVFSELIWSPDLCNWTKSTHPNKNTSSCFFIFSENALTSKSPLCSECDFDTRMKWCIEISEHLLPIQFTLSNLIKLTFDFCCKTILHEIPELLLKIIYDDECYIRREELLRFDEDISTILDRLDRRSISRWTTDTFWFELLHESSFTITWWWKWEFL